MRMKNKYRLPVAGLAAAVSLLGCAGSATQTEPVAAENAAETRGEPGRYLADFDMAWELVRDTHYDTAYNGVDWDGVRDELRPRAEQARTRGQNRALINEMVSRLNQSHFGLIPSGLDRPTAEPAHETAGQATSDGDGPDDTSDDTAAPAEIPANDPSGRARPGFDIRVADGRVVVTRVLPGGPADEAGVRPGWILSKVGRRSVDEVVEGMTEALGDDGAVMYTWQSVDSMLPGAEGSTLRATFLDASDEEVEVSIRRQAPPGEYVTFGNLPPLSTHLDHRWLTDEETGDPQTRIGYIAFNIFMVPIAPLFERAMYELRDADGVVIDLRGNPGGVGFMASSLSRFLVSEKSRLGTMTMRGAEMQFNVEPVVVTTRGERLAPFKGPVAIVIDGTSASTSEVFAGGLRAIGRAKTFGSPTAGMALPAAMSRLPSGDVLLHAIADYVNSDGTRLEGDGVPTDYEVPVRREDLLAGIDAPLREAARWIVNETAAAHDAPAAAKPTED